MEKIIWTDSERSKEVLGTLKEKSSILHTVKRNEDDWIGHSLRKNGFLKHVIEEKMAGTGRRGRRCKQLLDDLKEARAYCKLK